MFPRICFSTMLSTSSNGSADLQLINKEENGADGFLISIYFNIKSTDEKNSLNKWKLKFINLSGIFLKIGYLIKNSFGISLIIEFLNL